MIQRVARTRFGLAAVLLLLLACALLLSACGSDDAPGATAEVTSTVDAGAVDGTAVAPEDRPLVAVSFAVLADIVANIGGDRVEVWSVTPPGADAHTYEASAQDLARLSEADYLVAVGGRFEAFAEGSAWRRAARDADLPTLRVTDAIEVIETEVVVEHGDHTHDYTGGDPHFWLDPRRVIELVPLLADALTEIDPEGARYFQERAAAYTAELEQLDADFEAAVHAIPPERRVLIVHHDAYGYLAARFGFAVLSVLPGSGGGEASPADLAAIHDEIDAAGVTVVFREPQYPSSIVDSLARDRGIDVGMLMTDSFTEDAETYIDLIRFNIDSLLRHLG